MFRTISQLYGLREIINIEFIARCIEHARSPCTNVDLTIPLTDRMNNGHVTAEEADKTMIGIPTQPHTNTHPKVKMFRTKALPG